MKRLLALFFLFSCVTAFRANGQAPAYVGVQTTEQIPWERYTPRDKRFIVAGEAHHVSCIYPFQLSHLRYLVTLGFRNLVWEVPFSYGYIAQQYISTGSDSLLRHLAWSEEDLAYWKGIHALNRSLPEGEKLRLWGVDHELGDNVGGAYRAKEFRRALLMMANGRGDLPISLQEEYLFLSKDTTVKGLTHIKNRLKQVQHQPEVAAFFGERLPYFQVLVNRLDHYKVSRNDEMLDAFKEICTLFRLDSAAKFLGRFGWGHIDKSYKKSMAYLLENDEASPVRNSTYVVGVQYLNCSSFHSQKPVILENDGIIYDRRQKALFAELDKQDPTPIKIFAPSSTEKRPEWTKKADVLFVFSGFAGVTPLKEPRSTQ